MPQVECYTEYYLGRGQDSKLANLSDVLIVSQNSPFIRAVLGYKVHLKVFHSKNITEAKSSWRETIIPYDLRLILLALTIFYDDPRLSENRIAVLLHCTLFIAVMVCNIITGRTHTVISCCRYEGRLSDKFKIKQVYFEQRNLIATEAVN